MYISNNPFCELDRLFWRNICLEKEMKLISKSVLYDNEGWLFKGLLK